MSKLLRQRTAFLAGLLALLVAALLLGSGCQAEAERSPVAAAPDSADPAEAYSGLVDLLSAALEKDDPVVALATLRAVVEERRGELATAVTAIESHALTSTPQDRQDYIAAREELVRGAMQRFAGAQQQFRARASEAQKVELSEILNSLR